MMICAFCELRAPSGTITPDGLFICADCSVIEIYRCEDCDYLIDGRDLGSISTCDGVTNCPDCRSCESFKIMEVE